MIITLLDILYINSYSTHTKCLANSLLDLAAPIDILKNKAVSGRASFGFEALLRKKWSFRV
jgi:hypothetical protein